MNMKGRCSAIGAACSLGILISVASSAQTKGQAGPGGPGVAAGRATSIDDCFSIGDWGAREACSSGVDKKSIDNCEAIRPQTCRLFQEMHVASQRVLELEAQIAKIGATTYSAYLANDPAYVEDLLQFLKESGASWRAYRDAQCQLEPLVNGMSRRDLDGIVEQCRLERTRLRIQELEGMLRVLESNRER